MIKKIILLFILPFFVFTQNIKGKIFNQNNEPMIGVSVYLDGTTLGTFTDENGNFILESSKKFNTILVAKYLGYNQLVVEKPYEKDFLNLTMQPKPNEIEPVLIKKAEFTREEMLKLFREQFLGTTKEGKKCKILNEADLDFEYDLKNRIFYATSDAPIIVINELLGYRLEFTLYQFYANFNLKSIKSKDVVGTLFLGTTQFTETKSDEKTIKNRDKAYYGSSVHFFNTIINNSWSKKGFHLYFKSFQVNANNFFTVTKENDFYKIKVKGDYLKINEKIIFTATFSTLFNHSDQSKVIFKTDEFYSDEFGNNTHNDLILFSGDLGLKKAGNILPLNFVPTIKVN
jgi:CarboxypepD_reg-like domain